MTSFMTDEEIRDQLLKLGVNVGPVVDSTREFYRRKLALLSGEIKAEPDKSASDIEGSVSGDDTNIGEEIIVEKSFSQTYVPPGEIRARRSIHEISNKKVSSQGDYPYVTNHSSSTVSSRSGGRNNTAILLGFVVGLVLIIYFTLFHGTSTGIAVAGDK